MMREFGKEQREYFIRKIHESGSENQPLTEKDQELLQGILSSSVMVKALGLASNAAREIPMAILGLDLSKPENCHEASRAQGRVQGVLQTIELLFDLVTSAEEEDEDDGSPRSD